MFQPRKKARRRRRIAARAGKGAGSSRRLRIEGMERRLMLSATTPELSSPQALVPSSYASDQSYLTPPLATKDYTASEGGWIVFSVTGLDQNSQQISPDFRNQWNLLNTGQQVGIPDLQQHAYITDGTFSSYPELTSDVLDGHGTAVAGIIGATNGTGIGVSGLGDNSFNAWSSDSPLTSGTLPAPNYTSRFVVAGIDPSFTPAPLQASQTNASSSEGGSISIGNVQAELKQLSAASGEKPAAAQVSETTPGSQHAGHGSAATASLIPGEWGRASTFEMVSGAHSTDDHSTLNFERAKLRGDQSKSDIALPLIASGESEARPDAKTPNSGTHLGQDEEQSPESNQTPAATSDSEPIGDVSALGAESGLGESHSGKSLSSVAGAIEGTDLPATLGAHGAASNAIALAMDELGSAAKVADSWARSRVTAAVVLVLALERVAAFNWREKNRHSSDADEQTNSRRKPMRRRAHAALQLDAR